MDIQYIGEKSATLSQYITKYATKGEKSHTNDFSELLQNKSAASNLWSLGMQALANRECGALEAADTLLQISLFGSDRKTVIRWVDVSINRSRKVKSKAQLEKMQPNDDNIFCPSWVDYHYPNRPEAIENTCLYDFLRWFDIVNSKPKDSVIYYECDENAYGKGENFLRKRDNPYLLNHYKFNLKKEPESYYHSLLLLFMPWRKHEELKCGKDTYQAAFSEKSLELASLMTYHEKLEEIVHAREQLESEITALETAEENNADDNENENQIIGFEVAIGNELAEMDELANKLDDVSITEQIDQLNDDQKRVYTKIVTAVTEHCKEWDEAATAAAETNIMNDPRAKIKTVHRMFVSGVGGTGKSHLVNILRRKIPEMKKSFSRCTNRYCSLQYQWINVT